MLTFQNINKSLEPLDPMLRAAADRMPRITTMGRTYRGPLG